MKSLLILIVLSTASFIEASPQTLSLNTLITYINNKDGDEIAEDLLGRGYDFYGTKEYPTYQKGSGNNIFSIDVRKSGENHLHICSFGKFNYLNVSLEKEIKTNSKKVKFFYSAWAEGYVTEYLFKNKYYIYTGQGVCFTTNDHKPMKYIYISDRDLKKTLFGYE
jgi:hypothetical protein